MPHGLRVGLRYAGLSFSMHRGEGAWRVPELNSGEPISRARSLSYPRNSITHERASHSLGFLCRDSLPRDKPGRSMP